MSNIKFEIVKVTSIADLTIALLTQSLEGKDGFRKTNKQIANEINEVRKASGDPMKTSTTPECVAWYASRLRDEVFAAKHGIKEYKALMAYKTSKSD